MPKYRSETHRCLAAEYRAKLGVKQKEVADAIGMNQSEYSKIERGGRQLFSTDLIKLTEYFSCAAVVANNRMSPPFEKGEVVYIDFDGEAESGDYIFVILNHYETDSGIICQLEEWLPDGVVAKFLDGSTETLVGDAVKRIGQIVGSRQL